MHWLVGEVHSFITPPISQPNATSSESFFWVPIPSLSRIIKDYNGNDTSEISVLIFWTILIWSGGIYKDKSSRLKLVAPFLVRGALVLISRFEVPGVSSKSFVSPEWRVSRSKMRLKYKLNQLCEELWRMVNNEDHKPVHGLSLYN